MAFSELTYNSILDSSHVRRFQCVPCFEEFLKATLYKNGDRVLLVS